MALLLQETVFNISYKSLILRRKWMLSGFLIYNFSYINLKFKTRVYTQQSQALINQIFSTDVSYNFMNWRWLNICLFRLTLMVNKHFSYWSDLCGMCDWKWWLGKFGGTSLVLKYIYYEDDSTHLKSSRADNWYCPGPDIRSSHARHNNLECSE